MVHMRPTVVIISVLTCERGCMAYADVSILDKVRYPNYTGCLSSPIFYIVLFILRQACSPVNTGIGLAIQNTG